VLAVTLALGRSFPASVLNWLQTRLSEFCAVFCGCMCESVGVGWRSAAQPDFWFGLTKRPIPSILKTSGIKVISTTAKHRAIPRRRNEHNSSREQCDARASHGRLGCSPRPEKFLGDYLELPLHLYRLLLAMPSPQSPNRGRKPCRVAPTQDPWQLSASYFPERPLLTKWRRKLVWMAVICLAPEVGVGLAARQWTDARKHLRRVNNGRENAVARLSMAHAFYAAMGAVVIRRPQTSSLSGTQVWHNAPTPPDEPVFIEFLANLGMEGLART